MVFCGECIHAVHQWHIRRKTKLNSIFYLKEHFSRQKVTFHPESSERAFLKKSLDTLLENHTKSLKVREMSYTVFENHQKCRI